MLWPGSVFRGQVGDCRGGAEDDGKDIEAMDMTTMTKKKGGEIKHGPAQTRARTTST